MNTETTIAALTALRVQLEAEADSLTGYAYAVKAGQASGVSRALDAIRDLDMQAVRQQFAQQFPGVK